MNWRLSLLFLLLFLLFMHTIEFTMKFSFLSLSFICNLSCNNLYLLRIKKHPRHDPPWLWKYIIMISKKYICIYFLVVTLWSHIWVIERLFFLLKVCITIISKSNEFRGSLLRCVAAVFDVWEQLIHSTIKWTQGKSCQTQNSIIVLINHSWHDFLSNWTIS